MNIVKSLRACTILALAAVCLGACDMMTEDRDDCPTGLYVKFKYDYNLQRADMFNDHVGAVTLYIFDESGAFVTSQSEANSGSYQPLADNNYLMHVTSLSPGKYKFIAIAGQTDYDSMLATDRALFRRTSLSSGDNWENLTMTLDHEKAGDNFYEVVNNSLPLDTIWHGIDTDLTEVFAEKPSYDTISLVRDTKKINITLRNISEPETMDVDDYGMTITDHNAHILYDNGLDETDCVVYTPHATWNTYDRDDSDSTRATSSVGVIAHADFMTSRILYHDSAADDAVLSITYLPTSKEVVCVNLADLLSRLRTYEDIYRYSRQEFLDRGYDYSLDFYLNEGELKYVNISISVLSWSVRVQFEDLQ